MSFTSDPYDKIDLVFVDTVTLKWSCESCGELSDDSWTTDEVLDRPMLDWFNHLRYRHSLTPEDTVNYPRGD